MKIFRTFLNVLKEVIDLGKNEALKVAGVIFAVVAIAHIVRVFTGTSLLLGSWQAPTWASIVAFFVAAGLSFWMFSSTKK